jgi:hypothetical protein
MRTGAVSESLWYSPTRMLSGVEVRSRLTKEKRKGKLDVHL